MYGTRQAAVRLLVPGPNRHNRRSGSMPLLEAIAITKSFSGVQALKGVSFDLRAGEVHALVGENGAGKSTLIKIMSGALAPDSGTLAVEGRAVAHHSPAVARSLGIAAVYQQPSLFPTPHRDGEHRALARKRRPVAAARLESARGQSERAAGTGGERSPSGTARRKRSACRSSRSWRSPRRSARTSRC